MDDDEILYETAQEPYVAPRYVAEDFPFIANRMKQIAAEQYAIASYDPPGCECNGLGFLRTPELTITVCRQCKTV